MSVNPPAPAGFDCSCCECQGRKCLIPHPGHDCGRRSRELQADILALVDEQERITADECREARRLMGCE